MIFRGGLVIGPFLRHGHGNESAVFPSPDDTELYQDMVLGPDLEDMADWQVYFFFV